MEKVLSFLFILLLFSCKGEPLKKEVTDSTTNNKEINYVKKDNNVASDKISENCYDYLTELVRSSNFPFSEWKVDKKKVDLLIDEENDDIISFKLFFDTEGTGTIGWIEYHKKNGKLFNTSANLENPIELKYNEKWKKLFNSCISQDKNAGENEINNNELKEIYENSEQLLLPKKYDYDDINQEIGFKSVAKEYYNLFSIQHQENYKIAKLPITDNNFRPIILITYNENGQSTWHLFVLNNLYQPVSNLVIYTSKELDGKSQSITYSISKDYKIQIYKQLDEKIVVRRNYAITKDGLIQ